MTDLHTFYHVSYNKPYNTFPELEVNTEIVVGDLYNSYFNYFYNTDDHININVSNGIQRVHYSTKMDHLAKGEGIKRYPDENVIYPYINKKLHDLYNLNRELILENIRLQFYSKMPSRLKCLWVSKTKEDALVWINHFSGKTELKLICLESLSEPVKVDSMFISLPHDSLENREKKSHSYWSGEISNKPMIEYLFQGKAKIKSIEIINS